MTSATRKPIILIVMDDSSRMEAALKARFGLAVELKVASTIVDAEELGNELYRRIVAVVLDSYVPFGKTIQPPQYAEYYGSLNPVNPAGLVTAGTRIETMCLLRRMRTADWYVLVAAVSDSRTIREEMAALEPAGHTIDCGPKTNPGDVAAHIAEVLGDPLTAMPPEPDEPPAEPREETSDGRETSAA